MNKNLKLLIELQKTDNDISDIDILLKTLPEEIEGLASSLNATKKEYEEYKSSLKAVDAQRLQKEKDVIEKHEAIKKANSKLHEIKTNHEYTAAIAEIKNHEEAIVQLEDEQLEIMESFEEKKAGESAYKEKIEIEEKEFAVLKSEKEAEINKIKGDKDSLVVLRNETYSLVDKTLTAKYDKIAKSRDGVSLAELKGDYCQACHTTILPQEAVEVRVGETIHTCRNCTRILYSLKAENREKEAS